MDGWMVVVVIMGGQIGNTRRCYGGKKKVTSQKITGRVGFRIGKGEANNHQSQTLPQTKWYSR